MGCGEMPWDKWDEMSRGGLGRDILGWVVVTCHWIIGTRYPRMGWDEMSWDGLGQDAMGWVRTRCPGMGWGEMLWDKWDEMFWDGVGRDVLVWTEMMWRGEVSRDLVGRSVIGKAGRAVMGRTE